MSRGQRVWLSVACLLAICATAVAMQPLQRAAQTVAMQAVGQGVPIEHGFVNRLDQMDPALQNIIAVSEWDFAVGTQSWVKVEGVIVSQSSQMVVRAVPAQGMPILVQIVCSWGPPHGEKWVVRGTNMWVDEGMTIPTIQGWLDQVQNP